MPWRTKWIDNEIALEYKGVTVYHLYKNDDYSNGRMQYWFALSPEASFNCEEHSNKIFDVRDVAKVLPLEDKEYSIEEIIVLGIDHGVIAQDKISL